MLYAFLFYYGTAMKIPERDREMIIKTVNLETVCGITSKLPYHTWPEFAFAGKSNVGKSTLINALMNRKSYARTSGKPGKTQTINYYNVNDALYLVDLPGYGYATAGVEVKAQWGTMIENYLHTSDSLKAVFLLVDIRHDPSADDVLMFDWVVHNGFVPIIVATKADKLKRSQLAKAVANIEKVMHEKSAVGQEVSLTVIPFSGLTKQGRDDILGRIEELC